MYKVICMKNNKIKLSVCICPCIATDVHTYIVVYVCCADNLKIIGVCVCKPLFC